MSQIDFFRKNWDPFRGLSSLGKGMDQLLDEVYRPLLRVSPELAAFSPSVKVQEDKTNYTMRFDLPGLNKEDIKIDLHENSLVVSGERREEKKEQSSDRKTHLSEVFYGSFYRSFSFPEAVDAETAEAKYENGVLTLTIPKKELSSKRQLTIK